MVLRKTNSGARLIVPCAFSLAVLSCLCGLFLFLVKGPKEKSNSYLAVALAAQQQGRLEDAAAAALESVRLNPVQGRGWSLLSKILQQDGQNHAANRAARIAMMLQSPAGHSAAPAYATPAEFRLGLMEESLLKQTTHNGGP
jgi:Tfp pilus assembly protein PilF